MDLKGKVAIVTGGGTGIGAAITRRFVACGARVCIAGRRQEMLDAVAKSLPEGLVKTCSADVSDEKDVERILKTALSFEGGLHVLVNNAAIGSGSSRGRRGHGRCGMEKNARSQSHRPVPHDEGMHPPDDKGRGRLGGEYLLPGGIEVQLRECPVFAQPKEASST